MDFLTLQGKQIPFERSSIAVSQCRLDPKNPRIQYMIGQKAGIVSEPELDALIWEKDQVKALAQSILQNGGVYEPVVVQRQGDQYLVREGNCRTVACRHLPNDPRFQTVPAMIFNGELTEEDLAVLLADYHVASKIRWDAYEQAKHVFDLAQLYGKTFDWLSNHLRLSKSKIQELLSAYQATTDFMAAHPDPTNLRKFSFFQELMKKKDLRQRFNEDSQFKQRFYGWLADGKITAALQIRDLPAILANPEAEKALNKSGFEEAAKVLVRHDPSLESSLFAAVKTATEKLKVAPASEIQDLKAGNPQKLVMLKNLHRAIDDLAMLAGVKL